MAVMSMNKAIHAAIRRDLTRFRQALATFPEGDRMRAEQLATAWATFDDMLTRHHKGEHEIAWPALRTAGVSPDVIAQMDEEHDRLAKALAGAGQTMAALRTSASAADATAARDAMENLQTVAVEHLDHEEQEIEPIYLAEENDRMVKEMGRKFGRGERPASAGTFFAWVTDGASPEVMAAIKHDVPAPVLVILGGIFGRKYRRQVAPIWR